VINQEFGVVNSAYFVGDGVTSGVFGLAHPDLTQLYNISTGKDAYYSPFFYTAVQQTSVEPRKRMHLYDSSFIALNFDLQTSPLPSIVPRPRQRNTIRHTTHLWAMLRSAVFLP
jgi:hypothetical protein